MERVPVWRYESLRFDRNLDKVTVAGAYFGSCPHRWIAIEHPQYRPLPGVQPQDRVTSSHVIISLLIQIKILFFPVFSLLVSFFLPVFSVFFFYRTAQILIWPRRQLFFIKIYVRSPSASKIGLTLKIAGVDATENEQQKGSEDDSSKRTLLDQQSFSQPRQKRIPLDRQQHVCLRFILLAFCALCTGCCTHECGVQSKRRKMKM